MLDVEYKNNKLILFDEVKCLMSFYAWQQEKFWRT